MRKEKNDISPLSFPVVVKFHEHLNLSYNADNDVEDIFLQNRIIPWRQLFVLFPGIRISQLFSAVKPSRITEMVNEARKRDNTYTAPDLFSYYLIHVPPSLNVQAFLQMLLSYENVELAYIQNGLMNPPGYEEESRSESEDALINFQGYLNAAPQGIDAKYAWQITGGDGNSKVHCIDIEQGWLLDHVSLNIKSLPFTGVSHREFEDHGAAVLGVIMMNDEMNGAKGITPRANVYVVSQWRADRTYNSADALLYAVSHLEFGDIILIESQAFESPQSTYAWPIEIQQAVFDVIRLATALGITVIETAGNGDSEAPIGNDLDTFVQNKNHIFDPMHPGYKDSGAIIVAAATMTVPHRRMSYSNYGKRINCYAWGENIVTAGSYPGSSGFAINTYTGKFSGTSGAAAIIAGVAMAVQSITEANLHTRLSSFEMRELLSNTLYGTASMDGHSIDKIGVMPDLKKIVTQALKLNNCHIAVI